MKKLPFLILIFASTTFSQATIEQLQAKSKQLKAKDVIVAYDKYKDRAQILTKPYNLVGSWEGGAAIAFGGGHKTPIILLTGVMFNFKGQTLSGTPDKVGLVMSGSSRDWNLTDGDTNLYILYDGKRLELHPAAANSDLRLDWLSSDFPVQENLMYEISLADLATIAAAKDVSIKVGAKPREFKPELLQRFQKFIQLVTL